MDDLQAILRMKHGDPGGLEVLMERYQVKAARAAFLITYDEPIAKDVVQETFIRIYQRIVAVPTFLLWVDRGNFH